MILLFIFIACVLLLLVAGSYPNWRNYSSYRETYKILHSREYIYTWEDSDWFNTITFYHYHRPGFIPRYVGEIPAGEIIISDRKEVVLINGGFLKRSDFDLYSQYYRLKIVYWFKKNGMDTKDIIREKFIDKILK